MTSKRIGIEKINIYGCSLSLDQSDLARARGLEPSKVIRDFLIDTRSLNPPWEDTVTMGANAAAPLFDDIDRESIGMLIVGTEGAVDFGKPISTNIHDVLNLSPHVRNYETKHACYSGVAALDTAINWLAADLNHNRRALVIATDFSRMHINTKEEFVMGGVAAAIILSDQPKVVEYEVEKRGTWTTNIYDTFRPSARHEVGNNEVSLFTYMDALEGSYRDYCQHIDGEVDFDSYFDMLAYHTPFAGIAFQAHRSLCNLIRRRSRSEIMADFEQRVLPALRYSRLVGSTYGASNFVGLCGLLMSRPDIPSGSRIGFYAYGSGAIGEFYSGRVCPEAYQTIAAMNIDEHLKQRRRVSVDDYELIERTREGLIEKPSYQIDLNQLDGWYDEHYAGRNMLVLKGVENFHRNYEWS